MTDKPYESILARAAEVIMAHKLLPDQPNLLAAAMGVVHDAAAALRAITAPVGDEKTRQIVTYLRGVRYTEAADHMETLARENAALRADRNALREALNLYRDAVRIDVKMEGPLFMGANISALRRAWEHDRTSPPAQASAPDEGRVTVAEVLKAIADESAPAKAPAPAPMRHAYKPHAKHLFCDMCGYPESEQLMHLPTGSRDDG